MEFMEKTTRFVKLAQKLSKLFEVIHIKKSLGEIANVWSHLTQQKSFVWVIRLRIKHR